MIKVGFLLNIPFEYKGGVNYLKNLFYALNKFSSNDLEVTLFVPANISIDNEEIFNLNCKLVKTKILQRGTFINFLSRASLKFLNFDLFTEFLLYNNGIQILSHSFYIPISRFIKIINWIPDFQFLHYPHLYSSKQLDYEKKLWNVIVAKSDKIILSSYTAFSDFKKLYPNFISKVEVLQFLAQPSLNKINSVWKNIYTNKPYFFLPNQFWEHKNHIVVWKAVREIVTTNKEVTILVSGHMRDFRNNNNLVHELKKFIIDNQLSENIIILGVIPYEDVLNLIKNALAVINPSFFEGWSSTVEESKLFNKRIILSDIPIHREQDPSNAFYFDPNEFLDLSKIILNIMSTDIEQNQEDSNVFDINLHNYKTKLFAQKYTNIISEIK